MTARAAPPADPAGWAFGLLLLAAAGANLVLVHPVPAVAYALVAMVYLPPVDRRLRARGIRIPGWLKAALAVPIAVFTLGVSDLGDILDGGPPAGGGPS